MRSLLNVIDKRAFAVRLPEGQCQPKLFSGLLAVLFDVGERVGAVDFWFAGAEKVQIRPFRM